jgi:hypothetical protein
MTCKQPAGADRQDTKMPERVRQRPNPEDWSDDELMTLAEAAALFWPQGPLTTTSLRTAVRDRVLDVAEIAGKLLTNKQAVVRMSECRPRGETGFVNLAAARGIPWSAAGRNTWEENGRGR